MVSAVFYPGVPIWDVRALNDKDSTAIFTDIAALDNVVTAVGTSVDGTGLIAKSFYKSISFPNSPTTPNYGDSIACDVPIGKALITHLDNDEAAVTQVNIKASTMLYMLDFSTGSAVPTAMTRITANPGYPYGSPWYLNEIRYSTVTDNISVLEYGTRPNIATFETLLWTFPRSSWWTLAPVYPMNTVTQTSMDVDIDNFPVTVGEVIGNGTLDIHSYTPGPVIIVDPLMEPDACAKYAEIPLHLESATVHPIPVNDHSPLGNFSNNVHQPEVTEIEFNQICE